MSSIKNRVLSPVRRLLIFSIKQYKLFPGSIGMTSGSFQTQPRDLYVELYLKSGANYYDEIEIGSYIQFQAGSMLNEFLLLLSELRTMQYAVLS